MSDMEKTLLGTILLDDKTLTEARRIVSVEDFTIEAHRKIWTAYCKLADAQKLIDTPMLAEMGCDFSYVASLMDGVPHSPSAAQYAEVVRDASRQRKACYIAAKATGAMMNGNFEESLSSTISQLQALAHKSSVKDHFIQPSRFMAQMPEDIDWMIENMIQVGANGFIAAKPKIGKSWLSIEMAICLASGMPFLGHHLRRKFRTVIVSREDAPGLTAWRMRALLKTRPIEHSDLDGFLLINTKGTQDSFAMDNAGHVSGLISELMPFAPEFILFDVLNVLHSKDENDSQEMTAIMEQFRRVNRELHCGIGIIHHYNKNLTGSWTDRLRGSSAIHGFAEWVIGIEMADEARKVRKLEVELKAIQTPEPYFYTMENLGKQTWFAEAENPKPKQGRIDE